jgi:cell wall-associated NlpC family hydrolase
MKEEIVKHLESLIGTPYDKEGAIFTPENGGHCLSFAKYVYSLFGISFEELSPVSFVKNLKRSHFTTVEAPYQFMDVPLFYLDEFSAHHVGVMTDERWMFHCSSYTNGVCRTEITRIPWHNFLKEVYRHHAFSNC